MKGACKKTTTNLWILHPINEKTLNSASGHRTKSNENCIRSAKRQRRLRAISERPANAASSQRKIREIVSSQRKVSEICFQSVQKIEEYGSNQRKRVFVLYTEDPARLLRSWIPQGFLIPHQPPNTYPWRLRFAPPPRFAGSFMDGCGKADEAQEILNGSIFVATSLQLRLYFVAA